MEAVHTDGISLEEAYSGMKVEDSKMYSKAYFVTMDRVAALASVVRKIPTIYQTGTQYSIMYQRIMLFLELGIYSLLYWMKEDTLYLQIRHL